MTTIALLSPGAMGASVGAAAVSNGHKVMWLDINRSERTKQRSGRAGLSAIDNEQALFSEAEVVLSICPPHSCLEVAEQVAASNFQGTVLEGNAIAPSRARDICSKLDARGIKCVDGGIIGGPAWSSTSNTKLYLSGRHASSISALFTNSPLHCETIEGGIGAASALKMTFAAFSKGSTALLAAILAVAKQEGVLDELQHQWGENFSDQTIKRVTGNAEKAWRFSGEMDEIAATFGSAGLPSGFHEAASEVFARLGDFKDTPEPPTIEDFLGKLLAPKAP